MEGKSKFAIGRHWFLLAYYIAIFATIATVVKHAIRSGDIGSALLLMAIFVIASLVLVIKDFIQWAKDGSRATCLLMHGVGWLMWLYIFF